jgi:hypothetical protein
MPIPDRERRLASNRAYNQANHERRREWQRQWRARNRELVWEKNQWTSNGLRLTFADYERMVAEQGGVCALCKQPETVVQRGKVARLSVDHDHATGRVRGLLCRACNTTLARFKDDPELFRRALDYLTKED